MIWKQPVVNLDSPLLEDVAQVVLMIVAREGREAAAETGAEAEAGRGEAVIRTTIDYLAFSFTTDFVFKGS